jgi:hypothetical protein
MLETPPFCLPWESRFSQTGNRSSAAAVADGMGETGFPRLARRLY